MLNYQRGITYIVDNKHGEWIPLDDVDNFVIEHVNVPLSVTKVHSYVQQQCSAAYVLFMMSSIHRYKHQPSSTIINHHQPSSTIINHHQPSSTINHHQPSTIINHQPSSTIINHQPSSTINPMYTIELQHRSHFWGWKCVLPWPQCSASRPQDLYPE